MSSYLRTLLYVTLSQLALIAVACSAPVTPRSTSAPVTPRSASAPLPLEFVTRWDEVMSTRIEVTLPAGQDSYAASDAVFRVFRQVEQTANEWRNGSPLAEVNRQAGGEPVPIPSSLRTLLHRGVEVGALTGGAFDITWAALWGVWDFNATSPEVPAADCIAERLRLIDYRRLEIDDAASTARLPHPGMKLGLGSIAKGYALELAAEALRQRGISNFLLSAGGQFMAGGHTGDRPWRIGIRDPRGAPEDYFAVLEVQDASVSTSGDYERYFVVQGVRYHHILDPRTGMPARGLRSATVAAGSATLADALSTGIMVMGKEAGLELVERLEGVEAVLVDDNGAVWVSSGLKETYWEVHPPAP